jgi:hypothetical protein
MLFCVRRYYPSISFPFYDGQNAEFRCERGIIYDKGGNGGQRYLDSLIAHELLHLYGAADLAPERAPPALSLDLRQHKDDVMHTPTRQELERYCIGEVTAYLVGWSHQAPSC